MPIRVLVVDDSAAVRSRTCGILRRGGLEPLQAARGVEALERLTGDDAIDVVITELVMPGPVDGEQLIELMQRHPSASLVPVVAMTARAEKSDHLRCLELGAVALVGKRGDGDILLATVRMLAGQSRRRRRLAAGARLARETPSPAPAPASAPCDRSSARPSARQPRSRDLWAAVQRAVRIWARRLRRALQRSVFPFTR